MNYVIKNRSEVFSPEFEYYLFNQTLVDTNILRLIMSEVERYEARHNLQFINFFGDFMIFKNPTQ